MYLLAATCSLPPLRPISRMDTLGRRRQLNLYALTRVGGWFKVLTFSLLSVVLLSLYSNLYIPPATSLEFL